ncbi:2-keto-4-carboxy-3-hexenedioate hydratase [subsurface metagenome]
MFDAHSHWLPREIIEKAHFFSPAWGDIENQLALMDKFHIDRALILYPTSDAYKQMGGLKEVARVYNNAVAEVVNRYPQRFSGAAILPVDEPEEMVKEFGRATEELGFKAISLATSFDGIYLDDDRFRPLYEKAEASNTPIFVHPQTINPIGYERIKHPLLTPVIEFVFDTTICIGKLMTGGVLKSFPGLKFVFAHFGGVMPFIKERFDSVYRMLRGRNIVADLSAMPTDYLRKIYVDTSGASSPSALMCTLEMVGVEHTLWGSDYPGNPDVSASIDAIKELDIPSEDKKRILGANIEQILT